jgi:MoaA/NifB/PqqE/SkfB family radical SAM enzyme
MKHYKINKIVDLAMNLSPRAALNIAINQFEQGRELLTVRSMPQTVDILLTKACNLKCVFCKDFETKGDMHISPENFEKAARQLFPFARRVNICSGGEPYIHGKLIDILRIAGRYKVVLWLLSNGMLLKEDIVRTIVREELITMHGFSVDGIKAATVEAIRVNAQLDLVLENIKMLIRLRDNEGKKKPGIVIRYALMRSNIKELPDAVRYWGELGIDSMECSYLSLCNEIDRNESLYFHQALMEEVFREARKAAAHYPRLELKLPPSIAQEQSNSHAPKKCPSPWNFVMVDTNGRVMPCYWSFGIISMGDLFGENGEPFHAIWNNAHYRDLRRTVNDDENKKHYFHCSSCVSRFGMGSVEAHLGDESLLNQIPDELEKARVIAHRSRNR